MIQTIDLRSDTVTRPTEAMRAAMAAARVGDDQYGEDPTTNQLQARLAEDHANARLFAERAAAVLAQLITFGPGTEKTTASAP